MPRNCRALGRHWRSAQPRGAVEPEFGQRTALVGRAVFCGEDVATAAVCALVHEGVRPAAPEGAAERLAGRPPGFNLVEGAVLDDGLPAVLVKRNGATCWDEPHFGRP